MYKAEYLVQPMKRFGEHVHQEQTDCEYMASSKAYHASGRWRIRSALYCSTIRTIDAQATLADSPIFSSKFRNACSKYGETADTLTVLGNAAALVLWGPAWWQMGV